jgi:hypothetical protein
MVRRGPAHNQNKSEKKKNIKKKGRKTAIPNNFFALERVFEVSGELFFRRKLFFYFFPTTGGSKKKGLTKKARKKLAFPRV